MICVKERVREHSFFVMYLYVLFVIINLHIYIKTRRSAVLIDKTQFFLVY